jgi:hypothetical protein
MLLCDSLPLLLAVWIGWMIVCAVLLRLLLVCLAGSCGSLARAAAPAVSLSAPLLALAAALLRCARFA